MDKQQLDALDALRGKVDISALRERYTPEPIPPCRVCGGELQLQASERGKNTWACSGHEMNTSGSGPTYLWKPGRSICDEHYARSQFEQYRRGNDDVLCAVDELEKLRNALPALLAIAREHEQTQRDLAAAREELKGKALLSMAVHETFDLIANSSGVAGLHLNGDEAPWDELLEGGEYEKWLRSLSQAKTWLDAESAEARKGVTPTPGAQR